MSVNLIRQFKKRLTNSSFEPTITVSYKDGLFEKNLRNFTDGNFLSSTF